MNEDIEFEKKKLINNPYNYICEFVESIYPFTGKKAFELLSLMPCSLILPDIPYLNKKIRINLNVFFLAFSGGSKSSICNQFKEFIYYPIEARSFTPAELEDRIFESETFSLIIEDFATMSADERISKIIEGVIGEEKIIDRHTKRKDIRKNVEAVALLCGVPQDMANRLTSGTLFRTVCLVILHNDEEHSAIGKKISQSTGMTNGISTLKEDLIKKYYRLIQLIQAESYDEEYHKLIKFFNLPEKKYESIKEYDIPLEIREKISIKWEQKSKFFRKQAPFNWFRELQDGYRILICHSFLNYFNRSVKSHILGISQEDCIIAEKLLEETMNTKYQLLMTERLAKGVRSTAEFQRIITSDRIPKLVKQMLPAHLKKNKSPSII